MGAPKADEIERHKKIEAVTKVVFERRQSAYQELAGECEDWLRLAQKSMADADDEGEIEYPLSLIKEPNREFEMDRDQPPSSSAGGAKDQ